MRLVMDTAAMLARPMLANWEFPPLIVLPLIACAALYINGLPRVLRSREGQIRVFPSVCFGLGWASLFVALCSPIHRLSEELFWVHMTQHEILLLVSAPLLVLGQPTAALAWGIPGFAQPILGIRKMMSIRSIFIFITAPLPAWLISAIALWVWHVPSLFNATVRSDWVHAGQHLSFFLSALLFWRALEGSGSRIGYGTAVLYVFTTAVHTSVLGALLTFSARPWYSAYLHTTAAWGLTPLEDQQLGGLIMWIPAGTILVIAGLIFMAKWLDESQQRWEYTRTAELLKSAKESALKPLAARGLE